MSQQTTTTCDLCGRRVRSWRPEGWLKVCVDDAGRFFDSGKRGRFDVCSKECLAENWLKVITRIKDALARDVSEAVQA